MHQQFFQNGICNFVMNEKLKKELEAKKDENKEMQKKETEQGKKIAVLEKEIKCRSNQDFWIFRIKYYNTNLFFINLSISIYLAFLSRKEKANRRCHGQRALENQRI